MRNGLLLYLGISNIQSLVYFSITRHKNNVNGLMISYILVVSIRRHK